MTWPHNLAIAMSRSEPFLQDKKQRGDQCQSEGSRVFHVTSNRTLPQGWWLHCILSITMGPVLQSNQRVGLMDIRTQEEFIWMRADRYSCCGTTHPEGPWHIIIVVVLLRIQSWISLKVRLSSSRPSDQQLRSCLMERQGEPHRHTPKSAINLASIHTCKALDCLQKWLYSLCFNEKENTPNKKLTTFKTSQITCRKESRGEEKQHNHFQDAPNDRLREFLANQGNKDQGKNHAIKRISANIRCNGSIDSFSTSFLFQCFSFFLHFHTYILFFLLCCLSLPPSLSHSLLLLSTPPAYLILWVKLTCPATV